jgi:serine/threonine protein phosphatase 1
LSFWQTAPATWDTDPQAPRGHRVYAVGDVHGRDDLLGQLIGMIEADNARRPRAEVTIVFLGDLIDRGAKSAEVVERLRTYRPSGIRVEFLAGNHEEVLLRILDGESGLLADWLRFGGAECARSYGLSPARIGKLPPADAIAAIQAAIPDEHQAFLASFADTLRAGDYLFVHAGIRPGVALAEQRQADLRWIRDPFLSHPTRHEAMVVHGHTIREEVEETAGRIGIDTGAYVHGVLTAIGLEGDQRWYLQARSGAGSGA